MLRRLDCVLEPTKDAGARRGTSSSKGKVENVEPVLQRSRRASSSTTPRRSTSAGCSTTRDHIADNLRAYIAGFSAGARDVIEKFDFDAQIDRLDTANLLYLVVVEVRRDRPAPRRGVEPRDGLPLRGADPPVLGAVQRDRRRALHAARGHPADGRTCCSSRTTTLLTEAGHRAARCSTRPAAPAGCCRSPRTTCAQLNPDARLEVFGQELNAETYAICRSDMMLKGQDASHIVLGNSLLRGRPRRAHASTTCSPTRRSASSGRRSRTRSRTSTTKLGFAGRFGAGLPRDQRRQLPVPPAHDLAR